MMRAGDSGLRPKQIDGAIDGEWRALEFKAPRHVLAVVFGVDHYLQAIEVIGAVESRLECDYQRANDQGELVRPHSIHRQLLPFKFHKPFLGEYMARGVMVSQHG